MCVCNGVLNLQSLMDALDMDNSTYPSTFGSNIQLGLLALIVPHSWSASFRKLNHVTKNHIF